MRCCNRDMTYTYEYNENPIPITTIRSKCPGCGRVAVTSVRGRHIDDVLITENIEE